VIQLLEETLSPESIARPRVVLAVEHSLERSAYAAALRSHSGIDLVDSVGDSTRALQRMTESNSDVLIVDRGLQPLGGLETLREAARRFPGSNLMFLADQVSVAEAMELLNSGATGVGLVNRSMFKETEDFSTAVEVVASGRILLNPAVTQMLASGKELDPLHEMTDREKSVLRAVSSGLSNRAVAESLNLSQRTVENHLSNILEKLGARGRNDQHGRVQAVLHFLQASGRLVDA